MALTVGQKLGPYEILASIGAGGMGEVYRARDERLKRDVAIKVLPSTYSSDAERLRRFEQEAQAAGALNHPNITAVYDIGSHDGAPYIVQELLEGETLRSRLAPGAFAPRRAIGNALQIASGLAAAHTKGIVHRDLKPENIFVTSDGRVKILDFGLAKLTQPEGVGSNATSLPTAAPSTEPGLVMGTVGYMSPEQVRGKVIDARSDIFSFGTILYEMLSGRRAFHGDTTADTMSAILTREPPDLSETNRRVPGSLERIVRHCLEKSPEARFQAASDIAFDLEALSGEALTSAAAPFTASRPHWRRLAAGVAALAVLTAGTFAFLRLRRPPASPQPIRFSLTAPPGHTFNFNLSYTEAGGPPALSPDGRSLVFAAADSAGKTQLWLRALDSLDARALPGTENSFLPFWSPDSRSVAFSADQKLKRIEVAGGDAETLCDCRIGAGGTWGADGTILFTDQIGQIFRVSAAGGQASPLWKVDPSTPSIGRYYPFFLPDGRHFLYVSHTDDSRLEATANGVFVGSLSSPDSRRLTRVMTMPAFASGHMLLFREGRLLAYPFDLRKLEVTGEPAVLVERTGADESSWDGFFSVSVNGLLAYQAFGAGAGASELSWFDRSGKRLGVIGERRIYLAPRLSRDGRRIAVRASDPVTGLGAIWLLDTSGGVDQRLTSSGDAYGPIWSPDGNRIAYSVIGESGTQVRVRELNGTGGDEVLSDGKTADWLSDWSPEGRIVATTWTPNGSPAYALRMLSATGRTWAPWLATTANERDAILSYDGRWAAFGSDDTGHYEIYVRPFPGPGGKWQVSRGAGTKPRWRADGKELYYISPDGKMMAVAINASATGFEAAVPIPLFEAPLVKPLIFPFDPFSVTPDGQRFLIATPVREISSTPLTVIVNWPETLKRGNP